MLDIDLFPIIKTWAIVLPFRIAWLGNFMSTKYVFMFLVVIFMALNMLDFINISEPKCVATCVWFFVSLYYSLFIPMFQGMLVVTRHLEDQLLGPCHLYTTMVYLSHVGGKALE